MNSHPENDLLDLIKSQPIKFGGIDILLGAGAKVIVRSSLCILVLGSELAQYPKIIRNIVQDLIRTTGHLYEIVIETPVQGIPPISKHHMLGKIIPVLSGKGGVGKSTVAAGLALTLSRLNYKVGLLDADIYGPSIPAMLGLDHERHSSYFSHILPRKINAIKVVSMGMLIDPNKATIWRGPLASKTIRNLLHEVAWGKLDYLIVDLPPGTSDIHMTLFSEVACYSALIVTTAQKIAFVDALKAYDMLDKLGVNKKGFVVNMAQNSEYTSPFWTFDVDRAIEELGATVIGMIPLIPSIALAADHGEMALYEDQIWQSYMMNICRQIL